MVCEAELPEIVEKIEIASRFYQHLLKTVSCFMSALVADEKLAFRKLAKAKLLLLTFQPERRKTTYRSYPLNCYRKRDRSFAPFYWI